jgi:Txe/YoeB family toxin of toxin-antitoxin system
MKKRPIDVKNRKKGISFNEARKKALHIIKLIKEVQRDPISGTGKPEPLKHELAGYWSDRIDQEHRLVYC